MNPTLTMHSEESQTGYRVKQSLPFKHVDLLGRIQRRAPMLITMLKHLFMKTGQESWG